ncbi:hypothetical protein K469DRAFT_751445 [Zopfia rhizophila CBS 207.26]|uniref:Uncharacterized protein n=1 Tax=Zopfia rhizophila CBS 207.26 TaxID=1314779 RepID=A0A6A6E1F6_9PEZI|nr:hypothetical protein K469DRAFT_751445 [Zopfia rhizophila CBS 207.26]
MYQAPHVSQFTFLDTPADSDNIVPKARVLWVPLREHSTDTTPVEGSQDTPPEGATNNASRKDDSNQDDGCIPKPSKSKRQKPIPPSSLLNATPFAAFPSSGISSPTPSGTSTAGDNDRSNISTKPTCSLNLVCYRKGSTGCVMRQIVVTSQDRWNSYKVYKDFFLKHPNLIPSDERLFKELRKTYLKDMCGFWRRNFSLKTLRRLRLLSYTSTTRPVPVPLDEFTMQEVLWAYNHPSSFGTETDWIEWVFRLRQPDKRHALEFVEGWNPTRIAALGALPCVASTLVGVVWSALEGDVQTAFTVAGFMLSIATVLLALLAVISGVDS